MKVHKYNRKKEREMDDNFYTIPKHIPSIDVAISSNIRVYLIKLFDGIGKDLQLEDPSQLTWDIINDHRIKGIKDSIKDLVSDYLNNNINESYFEDDINDAELSEDETIQLMEEAIDMIKKVLPYDQYIDDVKWGKECFEINIFKEKFPRKPFGDILENSIRFYYDSSDVFERTPKEQMVDTIEEFIDTYY